MRAVAKKFLNSLLDRCGLRIVSSEWGPCGFAKAFTRLKLGGFEPTEIIDVGAAQGHWTRECMTVFPNARYLLADPLPENLAPLAALSEENTRVVVWNGAIGPAHGSLQLHVHGDQSSAFEAADAALSGSRTISVPMRTLDSFLDDGTLRRPCILKADVQGFEPAVVEGATTTLQAVDVVLLELSFRRIYRDMPLAHTVIGLMADRGFRIADICSYAQRARDRALLQSDVLFIRDGFWPHDEERYL